MKVVVYSDLFELQKNVLSELGQSHTVSFCGQSWYSNFIKNVCKDDEKTIILCLQENARVIALMPLWVNKQRNNGYIRTITSLSNYYTPFYHVDILDSTITQADIYCYFLNFIKNDLPGWDLLDIFPLSSVLHHQLKESSNKIGLSCFSYQYSKNMYEHSIECYDSYLSKRPSRLKNTIKRRTNKLLKKGDFKVSICLDEKQLQTHLDAYNKVYENSWKENEPYPDFIAGFVKNSCQTGQLRLGVIWLNNQPIASQIWIVEKDTAYIYKLAYDENFKSYSPGTILTNHLIKHVITHDKVTRVDFLTGNDEFKKDWMSNCSLLYGLQIANKKTFRGILMNIRNTLSQIKSNLRTS